MSHMPEGLLHEQAEAVFRETGMGPRALADKVAEYGAVIEGAVDANLELQVQRSALVKALAAIVDCPALAGVRPLVAGWNGDNLPEGKRYGTRHPDSLGARIETNCGAIYDLDEKITAARRLIGKAAP